MTAFHRIWAAVAAVKNAVVRDEPRYFKVRLGVAKGAILFTNPRYGSRMLFGLYEVEIAPYLRKYVRRGDVCYDIGAAGGYYALAFARLASPGRVFSFDPEPHYAEQLHTVAQHNGHLGSDISVYQSRVGASNGRPGETSLDTLVYEQGLPPPNVIKLDVDGGEVDVLSGAARVLREHHPKLIVEVHSIDLERSCDDLLRHAGYLTTIVRNRTGMAEDAFRAGHNRWLCAE
jgi:precorrin-6B methylase 2